MAEARDRSAWNRTLALLAELFNVNRDPKKTKPIDPMQFFPWSQRAAGAALKLAKSDFPALSAAIDNAGGTAERTAKVMDSGLGGAFRRMMSAVEGIQIAVGEALAGALGGVMDKVAGLSVSIAKLISANKEWVIGIGLTVAAIAVAQARSLLVSISGAADAAETDAVIPLRGVDPFDGVRGGMTALPNAAADAPGGLPVSNAGGLDLDTLLGRLDVGARTISVTVTDGTDPLEGVLVRFTKGAESKRATTDAAGQFSIALDDGTWSVAATLAGYSLAPTTLAVSADAAVTYEMTATSFSPSEPGLVTGYLYCYDEQGHIEPGVTIRLRQTAAISGTGVGYDSATRTAVSDAAGLVQFTGLFPGAKYQIRRETGSWYDFTIDVGATDPYALPSILGG